MPLEPGQRLSHYRLVEKIGEGGMGVVWKARDEKLRRDVALKVLPADLVEDPERRRRLLREARTAAAVNHPNIAMVHEVDEADGTVFIAMELVEGETLRSLLGGKPLAIPEALRIATEIAEGLVAAHQAAVIHRDLKPENVLIRADGHVKVLDFGLAKVHEAPQPADSQPNQVETVTQRMTREGHILGTPAYMSPEQARGEAVDARSDLFSFGSMLYEMTTGKTPFEGPTHADTLAAILNQPAAPPSQLNADVQTDLERVLGKCLEKDSKERYQDTQDLAVDLRKLRGATETGVPAFRGVQRRSIRWPLALLGVVGIVVLIWGYLQLRQSDAPSRQPGSLNSLAVLPFANLSGDPDQEYFADGMTETLIMNLSKIGAITVISRTSVMQYKDTEKSLPVIAQELGVAAIVEGSVLLIGEEVRVTAQLVEASTERHLWADSYDRDLRNILALHSEVAQAIAREIQVTVTPEEETHLAAARPVNPEAYRLYLLGQYHVNKWQPAELDKAVRYFQQAIALDPQYAQAQAGLAKVYGGIAFFGFIPPRESWEKSRAAAALALEIDSNLADTHAEFAAIYFYFDWDWEKAEEEFQRALELNPNYSSAYQFYTWFLASMGRTEEALTTIRRALELEPLGIKIYLTASDVFYFSRQYDQAITQLQEVLDLSPSEPFALSLLGRSYVQQGMFNEAIGKMEQALTLSPHNAEILSMLGHAHATAGQTAKARKILDDLHSLAKKRYVLPYGFALIHTGLGENEEALEWLESAYQDRNGWMVFLQVDPRLDPLREEPRFQDLLRRMNFPE